MRYFVIFLFGLLLVLAVVPLVALSTQQDVCERVVQTALEQANQVCTDTGRNQACYGHVNLEAQPQSRFEPFKFNEAGDIINITQLKTLRLSPMNMATGTWGVAMMSLQANLSNENPSQNVTLVLFGDVEVNNAIAAPTDMEVTVSSLGNANVRREPADTGFVLGTLSPGQIITAVGRNTDSSWVYVDIPDSLEHGWINSQLIDSSGEISDLNVINPELLDYGPMQAFYVRTGDKSSTCEEAPNDGLLIQTPEGAGEVRLWINEVKIRLGSTVFVQAHQSGDMTISTLEGAAHVEAFGVEQTAVAGMTVSVPLDADSKASAPPKPPEHYTRETVNSLPVDNLREQITVEPPVVTEPGVTDTLTDVPLETTAEPITDDSSSTQLATETPIVSSTDEPIVTDTPVDVFVETPTDIPVDVPTHESPTEDSGTTQTVEAPINSLGSDLPAETPSDATRLPTDTQPPDALASDSPPPTSPPSDSSSIQPNTNPASELTPEVGAYWISHL
jgi:SH3 domain-containing protein